MNKVYIDKNIYYIEDFIDKEDLEKISCLISDEKGWNPWPYSIQLTKSTGHDFYLKYKEKISLLLTENEHTNFPDRMLKYCLNHDNLGGWALYPHVDNENTTNNNGMTPKLGYVIYLSNNYEGGEMVYTEKNITLKPKPGTLIMHSAGESCMHGVKKVLSGERVIMLGFVNES